MSKVKFGLKNVHIAPIESKGVDDLIAYGPVFKQPGAVHLSLDAKGERTTFSADDGEYFASTENLGYEGELEVAEMSEEFRTQILKEVLDAKGVLIEKTDVEPAEFALGFEINGDEKENLFWYYDVRVERPKVEGKTTENTKEPLTDVLKITAIPANVDGKGKAVKAKTAVKADTQVRTNWFKSVQLENSSLPASNGK